MLYTIKEISELIDLSKVSIYKKLKLKSLQEYITKKGGVTYVSQEGFNLIQASLKHLNNEQTHSSSKDINEPVEPLTLDKEVFKVLNEQLKIKDTQIKELNDRLKEALQINQNSQVLLKDKPKLLDEPKKKGFWSKIFESS